MLTLSNIKRAKGALKSKKRLGRGPGSGLGKTSGRGGKGQTARSGSSIPAGFEGGQTPLYRRLPKVGFTNPFAQSWYVLNLKDIEPKFGASETVSMETLREKGLVRGKAKKSKLKILSNGDLSKSLTFQAHHFSSNAKKKIEAAGGKTEVIDGRS